MVSTLTIARAVEDPTLLAALHAGPGPSYVTLQAHQTRHRLAIVQALGINEGDRVLEIGCGQGDMTAALALAVGPKGHVTAIDPAVGTYGSPTSLGDAQAHLSNSELGSRITFHLEMPTETFLKSRPNDHLPFNHILLVHSSWYFPSPSALESTLSALHDAPLATSSLTTTLSLVEWSLSSSLPTKAAHPHILAALFLSAKDTFLPSPDNNIRTCFSPSQLSSMARRAGWEPRLGRTGKITPEKGLQDGRWEVGGVLGEEGEGEKKKEREEALVGAMKDALKAAVEQEGGVRKVRSMDVWWESYSRA